MSRTEALMGETGQVTEAIDPVLGTGRVVRTVRGHVDAVRGIALASDGTAVFSAGDRSAKKWPMNEKK